MEKITSYTYTSPLTGNEYLVVPETLTRMGGDWYKGEPLRPVEYTQYNVLFNGRKVQFAFSEEGVSDSVAHFEGVTDGWYSSPRD